MGGLKRAGMLRVKCCGCCAVQCWWVGGWAQMSASVEVQCSAAQCGAVAAEHLPDAADQCRVCRACSPSHCPGWPVVRVDGTQRCLRLAVVLQVLDHPQLLGHILGEPPGSLPADWMYRAGTATGTGSCSCRPARMSVQRHQRECAVSPPAQHLRWVLTRTLPVFRVPARLGCLLCLQGELGFFKLQRGVNALQIEAGDCWCALHPPAGPAGPAESAPEGSSWSLPSSCGKAAVRVPSVCFCSYASTALYCPVVLQVRCAHLAGRAGHSLRQEGKQGHSRGGQGASNRGSRAGAGARGRRQQLPQQGTLRLLLLSVLQVP